MKKLWILTILLCFLSIITEAQVSSPVRNVVRNIWRKVTGTQTTPVIPTYYFSSSTGNDSNTGLSESSPFASLSKLSSLTLTGDVNKVVFKKGDTWEGSISLSQSGTSGKRIIFDSYGTGAAPKLLGSKAITGWTKRSTTDIYVTKANATNVYQLFVNGVKQTEARYPNTEYDYIETVDTTSSFTSNELNASINYAGAKWIGRTNPYAMPTVNVTSSSSKTITLASAPFGDLTATTEGFILVGKLELLDTPGEWYYNTSTDSLYFWAAGNVDPDVLNVRASTVANGLILSSNISYITVQNIEMSDYGNYAIYALSGGNQYNVVNNNTFRNNGYAAMLFGGANSTQHTITNNTVSNSTQMGIELFVTNSLIADNTVDSIALFRYLGSTGIGSWYKGSGIYTEGAGNTVQYNVVRNVGYNGIHFNYPSTIQYNYVLNCNLTKDDGGGIYTSSADVYPAAATNSGSIIRYNIIDGSWGTLQGFTTYGYTLGEGVYGDESSSGVTVYGNSVGNVTSGAYYLHKGYSHLLRDNISYRARYGIMLKHRGDNTQVRKNKIYGFSRDFNNKQSEQMIWKYGTTSRPTIDSNTYVQHYKSTDIFMDSLTTYTFANWKTATGKDAASTVDNTALPTNHGERWVYNNSKVAVTYYLNNATSVNDAFSGATIVGSFTLQPFTSVVLVGLNLDCIQTYIDSNAPTMTAFTIPDVSDTVTIAITSFSTTSGATKYIITETGTPPELTDVGWVTTIPTTYTFATQGVKTLYAWCRDAAGNISESMSAPVTVDLVFPTPTGVWELEETYGLTAWDTVGTNNGTIAGGVTLNQTGKTDKAFLFDGVDDKVTMGTLPFVNSGMTSNFSISMWIKPVAVASYKAFLQAGYNNNDYLAFHTNSFNQLCAYVRSANVLYMYQTTSAINTTSGFYNAIMTWDAASKTLKFYVNGVLQTSTSTDYIGRDATALVIGGTGAASRWSNAVIDQVVVDNEVWTLEQVKNIALGVRYSEW